MRIPFRRPFRGVPASTFPDANRRQPTAAPTQRVISGLPPYWPLVAHLGGAFPLVQFGGRDLHALERWEQAFPDAGILGVDPDPLSLRWPGQGAPILVGGSSDVAALIRLGADVRPRLFIDAGRGSGAGRMDILQAFYPFLEDGGIYVLEALNEASDTGRLIELLGQLGDDLAAGSEAPAVGPVEPFRGFCRNSLASVTYLRGCVVLRKGSEPVQVYRTRSVAELTDDARWVSSGDPYSRIPARVLDAPGHVAARFEELVAAGPVAPPAACSAEMRDVLSLGGGVLVTEGGDIVDESLNAARNVRRVAGLYRPGDDSLWVTEGSTRTLTEHGPDRRYALLKQTWDSNYGHWLIDGLPRLALLDAFGGRGELTYVLNSQPDPSMHAVVVDSLKLAGVAEEQLLFLPQGRHRFARLIVPGALTSHPRTKSRLAVAFLEELATAIEPGPDRRLYLTRNSYGRRRLLNEADDVLPLVTELGFRVVATEKLTFLEQVSLLKGAEIVVGSMGAALANLAFSPRGVSVLALATEAMDHDFFYDIVCLKDGRYRGLQGPAATSPATLASDFVIDPRSFREALEWTLDPGCPRP